MASDYGMIDTSAALPPSRPRGRGWRGWLMLLALGFVAGAAAMGYALTHWPVAAHYIAGTTAGGDGTAMARPASQPVATPRPPVAQAMPDPSQQAALDQRVAGMEARIGRIDARADAAAGNADRAEGLLVAFAARRALDRGVALGYMEALLRERFGAGQPQAVATIIAAARQPVTLEELQAGLTDVGDRLTGGGPDESWLDGVRRELAGLVVVRRASVASPDPADRLARARHEVEAGHVAAALAEVARMPGRDNAAGWIAAARRYAAARDALDVIETAALLEPRGMPSPPAAPAPAVPSKEEQP